jgi:hypothetical protein
MSTGSFCFPTRACWEAAGYSWQFSSNVRAFSPSLKKSYSRMPGSPLKFSAPSNFFSQPSMSTKCSGDRSSCPDSRLMVDDLQGKEKPPIRVLQKNKSGMGSEIQNRRISNYDIGNLLLDGYSLDCVRNFLSKRSLQNQEYHTIL